MLCLPAKLTLDPAWMERAATLGYVCQRGLRSAAQRLSFATNGFGLHDILRGEGAMMLKTALAQKKTCNKGVTRGEIRNTEYTHICGNSGTPRKGRNCPSRSWVEEV
jgi:hypothetical protein